MSPRYRSNHHVKRKSAMATGTIGLLGIRESKYPLRPLRFQKIQRRVQRRFEIGRRRINESAKGNLSIAAEPDKAFQMQRDAIVVVRFQNAVVEGLSNGNIVIVESTGNIIIVVVIVGTAGRCRCIRAKAVALTAAFS
jgi:hypothetical protein